MHTVLSFVSTNFPSQIQEEFFNYLDDYDSSYWNWRDFTEKLSEFVSRDDPDMCVTKSSTWAVCQEFLGNLSGEELEYAETRGGIWSFKNKDVVSVREMLTEIKIMFP